MTLCTAASFDTREKAIDAKRRFLRHYRVRCTASYCEKCDKFHVTMDTQQRGQLSEKSIMILQCLAQGYRARETAEIVGLTDRTVEWMIQEMMKRFYALSRVNLVAIAIALGIVNPNDFVTDVVERKHL